MIELDNQIDKNVDLSDDLNNLIDVIDTLQEEIEKAQGCLRFESAVQEAITLDHNIAEKCNDRNKFRVLLDHIKVEQHTFNSKKLKLEIIKNKFHELMPSECPLCGQEVR